MKYYPTDEVVCLQQLGWESLTGKLLEGPQYNEVYTVEGHIQFNGEGFLILKGLYGAWEEKLFAPVAPSAHIAQLIKSIPNPHLYA